MTTAPFTKIVCIGVPSGYPTLDTGRTGDLVRTFCKIAFDGRKLSISGVETNGTIAEHAGQIVMHEWSFDHYCTGWDDKRVADFRAIWQRWHLNDMQPGCEHQRAAWDTDATVEVVTYKLTSDAIRRQHDLKNRIIARLLDGETLTLATQQIAFLKLPYTTTQAPDADGAGSGNYEVSKRETRHVGHIRADEHPRGLLCKPCEQCGYQYGSQWLHEDVPDDVLAWLCALPDAEITCTWWR